MDTYTLAPTPPAPPPPPDPAQGPPPSFLKKYQKYLIIGGVVFGFLLMFLLGMALSRSSKPTPQPVAIEPTETPMPTNEPTTQVPSPVQTSFQYLPGKQYTDDSVAIVTKTEPYHVLYASISRMEQLKNYLQLSKVDYYNGSEWKRETIATSVEKPAIIVNPLITQWNTKLSNKNGSNKKSIAVTIEAESLTFSLTKLSYEISARSLPGYTKFNYFGEGLLRTSPDEDPQEAYILITQTNASNASDLGYLANPANTTDQWLVFWDMEGNAYHYDRLASENRTNPFENYQIGLLFSPTATLTKLTPSGIAKTDKLNQYSLNIMQSPETKITFVLPSPLNKSVDKKLIWQTGYITGNVQTREKTIDGIGLFETIQKTK